MWLPGKRRLWKYYVIRKRSHNYGAFAPFFIGSEHSFAGPDAGRTLLVRRRTKNKTTQKVVYIFGGEITHKKYFFAGPDTGRTLLVRHRAKNKTTKRKGGLYFWWPWSDSNRHSLQNLILSQARLPIPPRGQNQNACYFVAFLRASTFFTRRALRFALCAGFLAGFSAGPIFLLIARLIAAISGVRRDGDLDIT